MKIKGEIIKLIKMIITIVDEVEEDENVPETYFRTCEYGKELMEGIILQDSNHEMIITKNKELNKVKVEALELFK